jgi:hypothetical protein
MPEGTAWKTPHGCWKMLRPLPARCPKLCRWRPMPGTSAPFNFNGLVRHYFLRARPEMGDVMVTLAAQGRARSRSSHDVALDLREKLKALKLPVRRIDQGGRNPARTAGDGNLARRNLRPRRRRPDAKPRWRSKKSSSRCLILSMSTTALVMPRPDSAAGARRGRRSIITACPNGRCSTASARCWAARPSAMCRAADGRARSAADRTWRCRRRSDPGRVAWLRPRSPQSPTGGQLIPLGELVRAQDGSEGGQLPFSAATDARCDDGDG